MGGTNVSTAPGPSTSARTAAGGPAGAPVTVAGRIASSDRTHFRSAGRADEEGGRGEAPRADAGGQRRGAQPQQGSAHREEMGEALIARMRRDDLKKSHIETASGHLRKHINPMLGDMLVSEVVEERHRTAGYAAD